MSEDCRSLLAFSAGYSSFSHDHPYLSVLSFVVFTVVVVLIINWWPNKD
jgi:hypothetical protein